MAKVTVSRLMRCHAIIDRAVDFEVDSDDVNALIDMGYTANQAFNKLLEEKKAEVINVIDDVDEITEVHDDDFVCDDMGINTWQDRVMP